MHGGSTLGAESNGASGSNGAHPPSAAATVRRWLDRLRGQAIGLRPVSIGADRVFVDSIDRYLAAQAWRFGWRDAGARRLIERRLAPGMVAVDVGANVGWYTLALARRVGAGGRVLAIEPEAGNIDLLGRAVGGGRLPQVEIRQVVAADYSGWTTLYLSVNDRGDHRSLPAADERRTVTIRAVSLDDLLGDLPRVDLVKLAIQGAEVGALRGLRQTMTRQPQLGILCAVVPDLLARAGAGAAALFEPLAEAGLRPHRIAADGSVQPVHETVLWSMARARGRLMAWFARPA